MGSFNSSFSYILYTALALFHLNHRIIEKRLWTQQMAAWTVASRQASNLARLSIPKSTQASSLIPRRGLASGGGNFLQLHSAALFLFEINALKKIVNIWWSRIACYFLLVRLIDCFLILMFVIQTIMDLRKWIFGRIQWAHRSGRKSTYVFCTNFLSFLLPGFHCFCFKFDFPTRSFFGLEYDSI